jgi:hypothetical protein
MNTLEYQVGPPLSNADLVRRGAFTPPYPMAEIRRCGGVKISLNPVPHWCAIKSPLDRQHLIPTALTVAGFRPPPSNDSNKCRVSSALQSLGYSHDFCCLLDVLPPDLEDPAPPFERQIQVLLSTPDRCKRELLRARMDWKMKVVSLQLVSNRIA